MARLLAKIDQALIAELKQRLPERVRTRLQQATDRIVDAKRIGRQGRGGGWQWAESA